MEFYGRAAARRIPDDGAAGADAQLVPQALLARAMPFSAPQAHA
jgi:hypothetical protein